MYRHNYVCSKCQTKMSLLAASLNNPMQSRLGAHATFKEPLAVLASWYGIARVESGPNMHNTCTGGLRYLGIEDLIVEAAPVVAPRTALHYSSDFARQGGTDGINTICAAYDATGHRVKKGKNAHGIAWSDLHASLSARLNAIDQLEPWSVTNCAEIEAVHKLLTEGAALNNIRVHSRDQFGNAKPPCDNCRGWLTACPDGSYRVS